MTNARDLIMGSSSPAFSFNRPGDSIVGRILTEPQAVQQKVFGTNEPAFWPSGDPKMQIVFQVQTTWQNYEGIATPDRSKPDNGVRTVYVKGKHFEKALKDAVLVARADWLDVGGMFMATYTGDDYASKAGIKPKLFDVRYQAPQGQQQNTFGASQNSHSQNYGANGMAGQGYQAQNAPRPPQQAQPNWQQPGWTPGPQQPAATGWAARDEVSMPAVPSHHGSQDTMPDWARPTSAPPVPSSAPPAPALSTLDLIRQSQTGTPEGGQVQPTF